MSLSEQIALWEALLFTFIGVSGVAFGAGLILVNRQHIISTMRQAVADDMAELRAGFKRDLELQLMRERARSAATEAELRSEAALARQEARMNSDVALKLQRRVEDLERHIQAGVVIQAGGDASIGGDVAGRDHSLPHEHP